MKDATKAIKNCEWTREKTATLISLYQSHECLWNNFIESYKNKDKRIKAINQICNQLNLSKVDFGKKIHNLRNQFNAEMKKLEKRNENSTEIRRSRWEHYEALMFLKDVIAPRPGFSMAFKGPRKYEIKYSVLDEDEEQHQSNSEIQETTDAEVQYEETTETDQNAIEFDSIPVVSREEVLESKYHRPSQEELETQEYIHHPPVHHHEIIHHQPQRQQSHEVMHIENSQIAPTPPTPTTTKVVHMETLPPKKRARTEECDELKRDQWDVFGEFVAAEFKNLNSELSRKKLKRKIMQVMLEVGEEDDGININISLN
ncbi:uncharacterized protein LOC129906441 isoform X2 [Episyrphus balteatus]|uniref:uncharacterized protein LOC129906441 isoform X2 n=1 Tax=Episyrphus balteatus TaxID=286459 RepID=UPI002485EBB4|nr:uncharacterized protein LOC129906441 isoform X2 [Episyrphus balteatus]